jgi:hypothetical protein
MGYDVLSVLDAFWQGKFDFAFVVV